MTSITRQLLGMKIALFKTTKYIEKGEKFMKCEEMNVETLSKVIKSDGSDDGEYFSSNILRLALAILAHDCNENEKISIIKILEVEEISGVAKSILSELVFRNLVKDFIKNAGLEIEDSEYPEDLYLKSIAVYSYLKALDLAKSADISLAMNLEAIRGEKGAFDKRLHELARPYKSQMMTASNTLRLLEDSDYTTDEGRYAFGYDTAPRCQDAISYRAAPQTHGGVRDTIEFLKTSIDKTINSKSEISIRLKYAFDFLMIGLSDLGNICERRTFRLTDEKLSYGLPTNLVYENPGVNHGFPVIQAVGTAVLGELKTLSLPTTIRSTKEENDLLGLQSGLRVLEGLNLLSKVITIEVYISAQGMDLVKNILPDLCFGKGTKIAHNILRATVAVVKENRYVVHDMIRANELVRSGALVTGVEDSIGGLD